MRRIQAIHQIAPGFSSGDAIGNQMAKMRALFRAWGYESQVYAPVRDLRIPDPGLDPEQYISHPDNVLIYHYSTYTPLSAWVNDLQDFVICYYHNVTPPQFFAPYDAEFAALLALGRQDVAIFKDRPRAWAGSAHNRADMLAVGFQHVDVIPYFLYFDDLQAAAASHEAQQIVETYVDGWSNWLFVGRLAPNKRQDDIIRAFTYYHRLINPCSRLFLVGSDGGLPQYRAELELLAIRAVPDHICFPGAVSLESLAGYYRAASVFVSMSEHEGFGIPLLEAMSFNIPVLAFKATAVPDTMGDAGVLVNDKRYDIIAEMVNLLMRDERMRQRITQRQQERLRQLAPQEAELALRHIIQVLER
ncbi:MAG: glycosyltransferase family 4 protein [Anaerolineae bacterium]|nr:glycosyltransferase family 4 protein [Anaerolineae bacterium]